MTPNTNSSTTHSDPQQTVHDYLMLEAQMRLQVTWIAEITQNILRKLRHLNYRGMLLSVNNVQSLSHFQLYQNSHNSWDRKVMNHEYAHMETRKQEDMLSVAYGNNRYIRCVIPTPRGSINWLDIPLEIFYTRDPMKVAQWVRSILWRDYDKRTSILAGDLKNEIRETEAEMETLQRKHTKALKEASNRAEWKARVINKALAKTN